MTLHSKSKRFSISIGFNYTCRANLVAISQACIKATCEIAKQHASRDLLHCLESWLFTTVNSILLSYPEWLLHRTGNVSTFMKIFFHVTEYKVNFIPLTIKTLISMVTKLVLWLQDFISSLLWYLCMSVHGLLMMFGPLLTLKNQDQFIQSKMMDEETNWLSKAQKMHICCPLGHHISSFQKLWMKYQTQ